jgi:amidase
MATVYGAGLAACAPAAVAPASVPEASHDLPDATQLASMIRSKEISAAEAVEEAIRRAEAIQPQINFLVTDTFAMAREKAKAPVSGPFGGVPFLVKDLDNVAGVVTRYGSASSASAPPAEKDDTFVAAMFTAGLICIGKSAAPENGYLPTTEPLAFAPSKNPWDTTRSTAGSSGGAGAATAAGVVPMAHANDGGGSIRLPAANNGLVGLKPSRGRMISEQPGARPLDLGVEGVVSRTVRDTAGFFAATEATGAAAVFAPVGLVTGASKTRLKVGVLSKGFGGFEAQTEVAGILQATAKLWNSRSHDGRPGHAAHRRHSAMTFSPTGRSAPRRASPTSRRCSEKRPMKPWSSPSRSPWPPTRPSSSPRTSTRFSSACWRRRWPMTNGSRGSTW